jgi:hypothetical protein
VGESEADGDAGLDSVYAGLRAAAGVGNSRIGTLTPIPPMFFKECASLVDSAVCGWLIFKSVQAADFARVAAVRERLFVQVLLIKL